MKKYKFMLYFRFFHFTENFYRFFLVYTQKVCRLETYLDT